LNLTFAAVIFILFLLVVAWCWVAIRGGSIKKQWWPIVIAVFLGWNILVPLAIRSATYHGKVVDEETGAPIAGAVVTVVWYHSPILGLAQTRSFQNVQETVTENDGSFSLWTWPRISLNPFTYVSTPPDAIVYKAGYAPFARSTVPDDEINKTLEKGIIKLLRFKTKEEAMKFVSLGSVYVIDVPNYRIPKLIHQVNVHGKAIGITSLYPEYGQ
jgi:hypothetical protein